MKHIYATFTDPKMAEKAAGALLDHGLRAEHLSIVFPEGFRAVAYDDDKYDQEHAEGVAKSGITTTTPADAEKGAIKGAGIGLATGTLAALAAVFLPGFGIILGGSALALALGGAVGTTAAGAVAGALTGYLKDQGVPEEQTTYYANVVRGGGALITITPTDEAIDWVEAENIMRKYTGNVSAAAPLGTAAVEIEDRNWSDIPNSARL